MLNSQGSERDRSPSDGTPPLGRYRSPNTGPQQRSVLSRSIFYSSVHRCIDVDVASSACSMYALRGERNGSFDQLIWQAGRQLQLEELLL